MRMVIDIFGEPTEVDSSHLEKLEIKSETKIGDVYFIESDNGYFSCHQNFWEPFKREKRINLIIPITPNP
jgi:hypothetical protein